MHRLLIADPGSALATSLALSHDVPQAANRIAEALGRPAPFQLATTTTPDVPDDFDALIVPGQGLADEAAVEALLSAPTTPAWLALLRRTHARGALILSSCSGVLLLAAAGLLEGRRCTTSWFLAPVLAQRAPTALLDPDALLVEDGPLITGGAALAQGEAMLALVARLAGFEVADLTARYLLLDNPRSQADCRLVRPMVAGDPLLAAAEQWARANLARGFGIPDLAGAVGTSSRTLARRLAARCGMSPIAFVNHIRREEARAHLARGTRFDQAAYAVGYADPSALRRLLARPAGADWRALSRTG